MAFTIVIVDGDDNVYSGQDNVTVSCVDAGDVEGIVDWNGVPQPVTDWPATPSGASDITIGPIDATGMTIGQTYDLKVYKPI